MNVAPSGDAMRCPSRPFTADWNAIPAPVRNGSTSIHSGARASTSPPSETPTARSAKSPPSSRPGVIATTPAGPNPTLSSSNACSVCPATTPTVNSATPRMPATRPCVETVRAPHAPPSSIHHGARPVRIPLQSRATPARPDRVRSTGTQSSTRPTANDTRPARMPLWMRTPSWPFTRAWIAVIAPIATAPARASRAAPRPPVGSRSVTVRAYRRTGSRPKCVQQRRSPFLPRIPRARHLWHRAPSTDYCRCHSALSEAWGGRRERRVDR